MAVGELPFMVSADGILLIGCRAPPKYVHCVYRQKPDSQAKELLYHKALVSQIVTGYRGKGFVGGVDAAGVSASMLGKKDMNKFSPAEFDEYVYCTD